MKLSPRTAATAAALVALTLGATAPTASAAGHDSSHGHPHAAHAHGGQHAHGHTAHGHNAHGHNAHGHNAHGHNAHGHNAHAIDKKVAQEKRQVLRDIAHKDSRLAQVAKDTRVSTLAQSVKDAVRSNVTADRDSMAAEAAAVQTTDSVAGLKKIRTQVRNQRVENYTLVINALRQAAHLQTTVDANTTKVSGNPTAAAANTAAQTALTQAVSEALTVTASSEHSTLRAVHHALVAAIAALTAVHYLLVDNPTDPGTATTPAPGTGTPTA